MNFDEIARRELPVLYRVARRMDRRPAEAEDLVAATLLAAATGWRSFDGRHPRSWMLSILRRECYARWRRDGRHQADVPLDDLDIADDPWPAAEWALLRPYLTEAVARLPLDFRLPVVLCDIEGLSYEEAAEALDLKLGTLKSRLFRGRENLRLSLVSLSPVRTK